MRPIPYINPLDARVRSGIVVIGHGFATWLTCFYVGISKKQAISLLVVNLAVAIGRELDSFFNQLEGK